MCNERVVLLGIVILVCVAISPCVVSVYVFDCILLITDQA